MYKEDLAFDNLQWLICHKTKPNFLLFLKSYLSYIKKCQTQKMNFLTSFSTDSFKCCKIRFIEQKYVSFCCASN